MCFICGIKDAIAISQRDEIFNAVVEACGRVTLLVDKMRPDAWLHARNIIQFVSLQECVTALLIKSGDVDAVPPILSMVQANTIWLNNLADDLESDEDSNDSGNIVKD